jgi:transposase
MLFRLAILCLFLCQATAIKPSKLFKQHSPTNVHEINIKSLIAGYCEGKSKNFCSVENLKIMNTIIEDRERRKRMRIMKDNIIKEIIMNIRHTRKDQMKERIIKEIIKDIQG